MLQRNKHKNSISKQSFNPVRGSLKIAVIYFIIGCLWIPLTDKAVSAFTRDPEWIRLSNIIKGWFFVLITALLIFALILGTLKRIKRIEKKLDLAYRDKVSAHENLEAAYEEITATEEELRQQYDQLIENQEKLAMNEERMHYLAYHDLLTGLPNKLAFYENGPHILERNNIAALMFIDIDYFKYVNDTMGHEFGDRLIVKVSERLVSLVGSSGEVYRFAGDEFIILLYSIENSQCITSVATHIIAGFKDAIEMDDSLLHVSLSIGISAHPEHGSNIMELLKCADIAMYKAKDAGKGQIIVFDQLLNDTFTERMNIEKQLYNALEKNELEVFYQPQIDLTQNRVTGLEALMRWNNPILGMVPPDKFIKIAEDSHLIIPLGAWVLRTACAFLKSLHEQGLSHLTMSVNISMLQLLQSDFNELVLDTLQAYELDPEFLELEITESVLVESYEYVSSKLTELRAHNIKIALDDFGTGYSSLSYLTHMPISTLKIDKSFIDSIRTGTHQAVLVEQIIMIGKRMNMCVIAEGVERTVQLDYLQEQGCDKIQGYLFSKPQSAQSVQELLTEWEKVSSINE
ncbi:putative bifunctional diguanylate cyclase/phosphodiesterase [Paenibacillus sp. FSL K6-2859]|jgi:diguanylate cyclase (GGDEF)-like protein|uniref:putative bifunctional diguanylate cyclase/phosphodiesterase n=1 Tax=Paenibacillus sp. FSL K6-2859 TaxID=2921482 RepID=UPI0030F64183